MAELATAKVVVKTPVDGQGAVLLWERHPQHPEGEIFITQATEGPVEVALTAAVQEQIDNGQLAIADGSESPSTKSDSSDEDSEDNSDDVLTNLGLTAPDDKTADKPADDKAADKPADDKAADKPADDKATDKAPKHADVVAPPVAE